MQKNYIDTIIGLPANLYFSIGIPACILVLKKCKIFDDVLTINAAEYSKKEKRQNVLLPEHIQKTVETYRYRKEEDRYSRRVSLDETASEPKHNLNISRYISTTKADEEVDLHTANAELIAIEERIAEATRKHNTFLKELGLPLLP